MRSRRGVSLIEVMMATTVLAIGLLALVAATATLARHRRAARLAVVAADLAGERAARAAACIAELDGVRDAGAVRERWTAHDDGGLRTVRMTVERPGAAPLTFATSVACVAP